MRPPKSIIKLLAKHHAKKIQRINRDPMAYQQKTLEKILKVFHPQLPWARALGLDDIQSIKDLKQKQNTTDTHYGELTKKINEHNPNNFIEKGPLKYMAKTSGSTAASKYIPYPWSLIKNFKRFSFEVFLHCSWIRQKFDILQGNVLVSPSNLSTEDNDQGIHIGTGTGIMTALAPKMTRKIVLPTNQNLNHNNFEDKISAMLDEANSKDIRSFTCAPAFAVPIFEELFRRHPNAKEIQDIWPNIGFYCFSGSSVEPYENRLKEFLGTQIPFIEVYSATESALAYQYAIDRPKELLLDLESCFYLFQAEGSAVDSPRLTVAEVEAGKRYRILLTTFGGLFNYQLGDIVEVTSTKPFLIKVIGREKEEVNIAGTERLSIAVLKQHLHHVFSKFNLAIENYFLCSYSNEKGEKGYLWCFESEQDLSNHQELLGYLDSHLQGLNSGYKASRDSNVRLLPPKIRCVPLNSIRRYILEHKSFGQGKFLTVHNDNKDAEKFFAWIKKASPE